LFKERTRSAGPFEVETSGRKHMAIKKIRVCPPIGIARLGNSQNGYFIGPEIPGEPTVPPAGYRDSDAAGFIKRQAARFHLFAYDENDKFVSEITASDAAITWTVHVANTKAASEWFHSKSQTASPLRNAAFADRHQLKLDPGPASVAGTNPDFQDLALSKAKNTAKDLTVDRLFLGAQVEFILGTVTTILFLARPPTTWIFLSGSEIGLLRFSQRSSVSPDVSSIRKVTGVLVI
jgi:hypothetical protein